MSNIHRPQRTDLGWPHAREQLEVYHGRHLPAQEWPDGRQHVCGYWLDGGGFAGVAFAAAQRLKHLAVLYLGSMQHLMRYTPAENSNDALDLGIDVAAGPWSPWRLYGLPAHGRQGSSTHRIFFVATLPLVLAMSVASLLYGTVP